MKNGYWALFGFLMFALGLLSLILNLVGVEFAFFIWLDAFGGVISFLFKLLLIIFGVSIMYLNLAPYTDDE